MKFNSVWWALCHCSVLYTWSQAYRGIARLSTLGGQERNISSFFYYFLPFFVNFSSSIWSSRWEACPPGKALSTLLQTCSQDVLRGWADLQTVNLSEIKIDLLDLSSFTETQFLTHYVAKSGPFGWPRGVCITTPTLRLWACLITWWMELLFKFLSTGMSTYVSLRIKIKFLLLLCFQFVSFHQRHLYD